jgi:type IV secretory pathway VirB6-like protein
MGFKKIHFEGDAKSVVDAVNDVGTDRSSLGLVRASTTTSSNLALQNNKKYTFCYFDNLPFYDTLFSLSTSTIHFYYFIKILFSKDLFILSLTFIFLNIYIFLMIYFTNIYLILTVIFFKIYNFFNGHIFYCVKS